MSWHSIESSSSLLILSQTRVQQESIWSAQRCCAVRFFLSSGDGMPRFYDAELPSIDDAGCPIDLSQTCPSTALSALKDSIVLSSCCSAARVLGEASPVVPLARRRSGVVDAAAEISRLVARGSDYVPAYWLRAWLFERASGEKEA